MQTAAQIEQENNSLRLIVSTAKITAKIGSAVAKTGKVTGKELKKIIENEGVGLVEDLGTLLDGELNADDAFALINLLSGIDVKGLDKLGITDKIGKAVGKVTKTDVNIRPTITINGRKLDAQWQNKNGKTEWINPLTNKREVIPDGAKVHVDHILSQNEIKNTPGFDTLPKNVQNELLNDPVNLQPMLAPANCSKGCTTEWVDGGWKLWGEDKISPAYKTELESQQARFAKKIEDAIKQYKNGTL